ncbi:hypothetical protein SK128_001032 [Halocaridina rubra]|uniref:Alpha/beta hydrolase fold-5 domain-containing protein n=1 Tax=Halocaridina rubra TaxID=373956 RepID=A0AAN8X8A1_HALRR
MDPYTSTRMLIALALLLTGGQMTPSEVASMKADEEPIILPPIVTSGTEAALLLVPGADINGQFYQPLAEAIQEASSLKLWVGLVRPFPLDIPNPINLIPDLDNTLQMMRDQGMTTSTIFLAGHSLGGTVLQNEQWSQENGVVAWLLFASYVNKGELVNTTLPVMHLSGDLDGMTRVTRISSTFKELLDSLAESPENKYEKAVIVLEDINHMHFASGDPPSLVAEDDILSPLPEAEGHALLAQHISAYLTTVSGFPAEEVANARATLEQAFVKTSQIMQPLMYLTDLMEGDGTRALWTEAAQRVISTVSDSYQNALQVTDSIFDTVDAFASSKPQLELVGETVYVTTSTHVYPRGLLEATGPQTASEIGAKFKSREAIMEALMPFGVEFGEMVTCKEVNQAGFELAWTTASEVIRDRFTARGGQVTFLEDDEKATGSGWLYASLNFNLTLNDLAVTSPTLVTSVDTGLGLGGMHYCKLLAPTRALEYIMIDGLKYTQP